TVCTTPCLFNETATTETYTPAFDGLAYRGDGQTLYVVDYWAGGGAASTLRTVDRPDLGGSDLSLQVPASVKIGTGVTVSGRLTLQDGSPAAGDTIVLSAMSPD